MLSLEYLIERIVNNQFDFHKDIAVQDIYKLLYQGCYGAEHLIKNRDFAKKAFFDEVLHLIIPKQKPTLPIVERISVKTYRVNFIPYAFEKNSFEFLFNIFIKDNSNLMKPRAEIAEVYNLFAKKNQIINWFKEEEIKDFFDWVKENNFPVMHHSKNYQDRLNKNLFSKPHYRIIKGY